ncbi:MAG: hypothetical protein M1827_004922 [Pycnora praestabilis]|nr:MAG: hypothetical protein M1827_004922 [Pycnora praestabilis]
MQRIGSNLGFSAAAQAIGSTGEQEPLLADEEQADEDGCFTAQTNDQPCAPNPYASLPIYNTIHRLRREIIIAIDDPYTLEQLKAPRMNISLVRPLVNKLYDLHDVSIVYCLLVNRLQFLREQSYQAHHQTVSITRAVLCELLANRILRRFDEDNPGPKGLLLLANVLVAGFEPFQGAPDEIIQEYSHALHWSVQKRGGYERRLPALEVAIISESKAFLSGGACQKVVDAIYNGRIVYTPTSFIDILPDHYKHKPISLYDPRKAPILDQYRLIVPRTRNILEVGQFVLLLVLYILVMGCRNPDKLSNLEIVFCVYAFGWVLDQFASILEHGWEVYTQNLWSFLDITFALIYGIYLVLRIHGFATDNTESSRLAYHTLSMAAPVLVPRLAFNLMSENMLFVSLRAMMADFAGLTLLAVWCFAGFLLAMTWLGNGLHRPITISKWMLWVWFGLDGTGIQRSVEFQWLLGPTLMVTFAFLGNTLFLTILVSMLSSTFSIIVSNATAEIQFRRAVSTFEGVKSDAVFAYQPPFNILALCVMLPLKFVLTPRWFHKINVYAVRFLNAPILLLVGIYERRMLWSAAKPRIYGPSKPRSRLRFWGFSRFSVHGDIQAVFDADPPKSTSDDITDANLVHADNEENGFLRPPRREREGSPDGTHQRRRFGKESIASMPDVPEHLPDLLQEIHDGGSNTKTRLETLEASTMRIEEMLKRLCENVIDNASEAGVDPKTLGFDE